MLEAGFSLIKEFEKSDCSVAIRREISTITFKESSSLNNMHIFIDYTNDCCYVPKYNDTYLFALSIQADYF